MDTHERSQSLKNDDIIQGTNVNDRGGLTVAESMSGSTPRCASVRKLSDLKRSAIALSLFTFAARL